MITRVDGGRTDPRRCWGHGSQVLALVIAGLLPLASEIRHAQASEFEPVAWVSFAGAGELSADLESIGNLLQNPSLPTALSRVLARRSGVKSWQGLDAARPWGAAIATDGVRLAPMLYLPVTDAEALLESLEPMIGPAVIDPSAPGRVWKIGRGATTGFVSQQGKWAYVVQTPDLLPHCLSPENLDRTFASMPAEYDVALRFFPTRLPEALRTWAIDMVREQAAAANHEKVAAGEAVEDARQRMTALAYQWLESSFSEQRQVTWCWRFDRTARRARLDLEIVPEPSSQLASHLTTAQVLPRRPLSVGQSVASLHAGLRLEPDVAKRIETIGRDLCLLACKEDAAGSPLPWQLLSAEVFKHALSRGTFDLAVAITSSAPQLSGVARIAGGGASDLQRLEQVLQNRAQSATQWSLETNTRQLKGQPVHQLRSSGASQATPPVPLFEAATTIQITAANKDTLLAFGPRSEALLEQAATVDMSRPMPDGKAIGLTVHTGMLASSLGRSLTDSRQTLVLQIVSANLRAGDDRLELTVQPVEGVLRAELSLHEGIIRAAAVGLNLFVLQELSAPDKSAKE